MKESIMPMITRRKFIQGSSACGVAACFLMSSSALAEWPTAVFTAKKKNDVIDKLFGGEPIEASDRIEIKAPEIAENGAVVPIKISASLPNVESISIVVDKNPRPLAARFMMPGNNKGTVATRIKLADKSDVTAIVKANGKLYSATKYVKVTRGGCGG
jgi:sulfur-oxidizing protein SoxY